MRNVGYFFLVLVHSLIADNSYSIELTLGGFPSYMRTRARFIKNATFVNSLTNSQAELLGFNNAKDDIFFVDTRLRLTPQLVLSDVVTIRAQVDISDNNIWGGLTSGFLGGESTIVNSSLSFSDRFRGALLTGPNAVDEVQFFNVRMLHADMVLPHKLGFTRIGRQPVDFGLGIQQNGGWDPNSDLGFIADRLLWVLPIPMGNSTISIISTNDRITQGNTLITGVGDSYALGGITLVYNNPSVYGANLTIAGQMIPYIKQNNLLTPIGGPVSGVDIDFRLYSGFIDVKTDFWRFAFDLEGIWGKLNFDEGDDINIEPSNILFAVRGEVYPMFPIDIIAGEFGWANGNDASTPDLEGIAIFFNPAYNLDNLLFKHIIPNIYQREGSVINAIYARAWGSFKVLDAITFTPQVVVAWNEETNSPLVQDQNVSKFLGTEFEGTLTWQIYRGVNLDVIGSIVIFGKGLKDLLRQQAAFELNNATQSQEFSPGDFDSKNVAWAIQTRLLIYLDEFFK